MTALLATVAGCAQPPVEQAAAPPPNPFGYLRPSPDCAIPKLVLPASGAASTTLGMTADTGYCALHLSKPGGGPFASFLVTAGPMHGQPLNYNYNGASVITYTPNTGYVGPDQMTVELVPGASVPRTSLTIAITVNRAGTPAS